MADHAVGLAMPETDIAALKEALCAQQQLLQQLYQELDVEREASATAVSEALSMILRLQGEKAAVKMEASQYKRMAEEKIGHAEESLAIFEDVMYQKEMEITSLEYQIQAYRYKIVSMGCSDLGSCEIKFPDDMLSQRNDSFFGEIGVNANVRRLTSLPAGLPRDFFNKKNTIDRERSAVPELDSSAEEEKGEQVFNDQSLDVKKNSGNTAAAGDFNVYWEQIKKLDELVKEMSDGKDVARDKPANLKVESRTCSILSRRSSMTSLDLMRSIISPKFEQVKSAEGSSRKEAVVDCVSYSNVHDVFEVPVPETFENQKFSSNAKNGQGNLILNRENRLKKPDLVLEETFALPTKDENELIETKLLSANHEKRGCKQRDGVKFDCKGAPPRPTMAISGYQAELQQLNRRIERLESERNSTRHEISDAREEEMNLLKEIREQLNSIQSEVRSLKPKKSPPPDDSALLSLKEGMLYFWF